MLSTYCVPRSGDTEMTRTAKTLPRSLSPEVINVKCLLHLSFQKLCIIIYKDIYIYVFIIHIAYIYLLYIHSYLFKMNRIIPGIMLCTLERLFLSFNKTFAAFFSHFNK